MKALSILIAVALMSGCVSRTVVEEPAAAAKCDPLESANKLLAAASQFIREKGRKPSSLSELVPQYIAAIPAIKTLSYNRKNAELRYSEYVTVESEQWGCTCTGKLGQEEFQCVCYF